MSPATRICAPARPNAARPHPPDACPNPPARVPECGEARGDGGEGRGRSVPILAQAFTSLVCCAGTWHPSVVPSFMRAPSCGCRAWYKLVSGVRYHITVACWRYAVETAKTINRAKSFRWRMAKLPVAAWRRATAKTPKIRHVRRHAITGVISARSEGVPRQTEQKMSSTRCRTYAVLAGTARHQRQMPKMRHVRRHASSGASGARPAGAPRQGEQQMGSTRCRTHAVLAGTADDQQSPTAGLPEPKWSPLADPSARQQLTLRTPKATGSVALNKLLIQQWLGAPGRSPPAQRRPQHSSKMPQTNLVV